CLLLGAIFILFLVRADLVIAAVQTESIYSFDVGITVRQNSSFLVEEKILYSFGDVWKHGIIRSILLNNIGSIKVLGVIDEFGNPYNYQLSKEGGYLKIKIGDENKTITGVHLYNIFYEVKGGLGFFKGYDELYWNVTGNEWPVSINAAQVTVRLPQSVPENDLKKECFTGPLGSRQSVCNTRIGSEGDIIFESNGILYPREGLTIVLGWPTGLTKRPFVILPLWFRRYWPVAFPISTFIFLFMYWWKRGRDFPIRKPIMVFYEPPANLKPAQVGAIMRQKVGPLEISSTIVDLAVRGHLKIKEIKKTGFLGKDDYEIAAVKKPEKPGDLSPYEEEFLNTYFPDFLRSAFGEMKLKVSEFHLDNRGFGKNIMAELTGNGYFVSSPEKIRNLFKGIGSVIILLAWAFGWHIFSNFIGSMFLGSMVTLSGIVFILFGFVMPKRSKKGADIHWQIVGFKEYIDKAEKYRMQFAEKEYLFEEY
ncbi:MAG: DUF2207 domain-containing protein, partial [bacterium]|nr:DUF2207 domain-containing protein [bacterium]